MREVGRWQDKVELSLDNRQIYFLFFGTAVAACLVFTVGVLVGKRLESGTRPAAAASDPLAALDRLGGAGPEDGLTFHKQLADGRGGSAPDPLAERPRPDRRSRDAARAPQPAPRAVEAAPAVQGRAAPGPAAPGRDRRQPARAAADEGDAAEPPARPERYVVQLAPVQAQGDAEALVRKLTASGYRPYLISSNSAKGVTYRVRLGEFQSKRAAETAKADFEQRQRAVAFVSKVK
ncbi:MAG TPA: SPOR domain-containing protein [Polyangia bacterium]|jgi:cell division septation protein DedD